MDVSLRDVGPDDFPLVVLRMHTKSVVSFHLECMLGGGVSVH
jgi:hypothetical protein